MLLGVVYGIIACMIWGGVYVAPLLLPDYEPAVLATCRYVVFGALSLGFAIAQLKEFKHYRLADWKDAGLLGVVGNIFYYWLLSEAVQRAGAPITGAFTAMIPVLCAVIGNWQAKRNHTEVPWGALTLPLMLIIVGMVCLNWTEFVYLVGSGRVTGWEFWSGVVFAIAALFVWTWYPLKNSAWILAHPERSVRAWSTAQGLTLFPASLILLVFFMTTNTNPEGVLGPRPEVFIAICLTLGFVCSWVGIVFWNLMSQRLPPALGGQMIIFETIFAVVYAHMWRAQWPSSLMLIGMAFLLGGITLALRVFHRARLQRTRVQAQQSASLS